MIDSDMPADRDMQVGRKTPLAVLALAGLALAATACVEGRPAPEPTAMVSVTDGLTFLFGDEDVCQSATAAEDVPVDCDVIRNPEGQPQFDIAKAYPAATVVLKPFALDIHEVTNVQYQYCVERGDCSELQGFNAANITDYYRNRVYDDFPVLNVTWEQAREYCAFVGKRLPTQFEWERVAGGAATAAAEKRRYPFTEVTGEQTPSETIQDCRGLGIPITYCGADRNPIRADGSEFDRVVEGGTSVFGLGGNVSEWVIDYRVEDFTCQSDFDNCPDCWDCTTPNCQDDCYRCDECRNPPAGMSCYALCGEGAADDEFQGYPICFRYQEPLYCGVNAAGESECCLGGFAGEGGTGCWVAEPADRRRMFRGGSYNTSGSQTCTIRSADRSQSWQEDEPLNRLGFRCARTL